MDNGAVAALPYVYQFIVGVGVTVVAAGVIAMVKLMWSMNKTQSDMQTTQAIMCHRLGELETDMKEHMSKSPVEGGRR